MEMKKGKKNTRKSDFDFAEKIVLVSIKKHPPEVLVELREEILESVKRRLAGGAK
jgi:hypothetical protein